MCTSRSIHQTVYIIFCTSHCALLNTLCTPKFIHHIVYITLNMPHSRLVHDNVYTTQFVSRCVHHIIYITMCSPQYLHHIAYKTLWTNRNVKTTVSSPHYRHPTVYITQTICIQPLMCNKLCKGNYTMPGSNGSNYYKPIMTTVGHVF